MKKPAIKHLINLSLLSLAIVFSVLFSEFILRLIFKPVNFLMPYLVTDEILGHKIAPNSGGHDAWGYRNKNVPKNVDIVAIGDSQTYGVSATADNSWPAILQKFTQKKVYNLSLGGYGPPQYYYLLKNYALNLHPDTIIIGFYFGNDFLESYKIVYGKDYWKYLRDDKLSNKWLNDNIDINNTKEIKSLRPLRYLRNLLAHHSVLYRILTIYTGDNYKSFELKYLKKNTNDTNITILNTSPSITRTAFTPSTRLKSENLEDERIQEGIRINLKLFSEMSDVCKKSRIKFIVLLIPTKENVFAKYIKNNRDLENSYTIDKLIDYENSINIIVRSYFNNNNVTYLDSLDYLRENFEKKQLYFSDHDGHPNKNGYEVIASSVHQLLLKTEYMTK